MAHTYIVTSATHYGNVCNVVGTVDNWPVSISVSFLDIVSLPSTAAVQNFIAPLMLAAAASDPKSGIVGSVTTIPSVTAAGTFTQ